MIVSTKMGAERETRYQETLRVTIIGSVVDLLLGIIKIFFGVISHSQALIADGLHSLSDLATDGLVIYAAKHASRGADEEHPYGHGRIETISTVGLGIVLVAVAVGVAVDAVRRLFDPQLLLDPSIEALIVAGASVLSKELIYHYTMRTARKYRSDILRANAWHSRTDAISSIVVLIGIAGAMAGLKYLDAVAAVVVGVLIAKIGWDLGWNSIHELVDTGLERDRVSAIRRAILEAKGVRALHMLRTRRMGGDAFVDVHIQVEPTLSVSEGHHISEYVRRKVMKDISEVADITVHVDCEDDQSAAENVDLPLRQILIERLGVYFKDIPEAEAIERITLHYINGKINIELLLPIDLIGNESAGQALNRRFQESVTQDQQIGNIYVYFH